MEYLTPYLNPEVVYNKSAHKIFRRSVDEHMNRSGVTRAGTEMNLLAEGYVFDEATVMMSPSVVSWYCNRYNIPTFNETLYPEYFFSYTPGLKSIFDKIAIDLSFKGYAYPDVEAVIDAFKSFKRTKNTASKLCAQIMSNEGVVLCLGSLRKVPGPISVYAIPRPERGEHTPSYDKIVKLNNCLGVDTDLSLISDFEDHGLQCKYVSYRVSGGKVLPYVGVELSYAKNQEDAFKTTMKYLQSKGLSNKSHYSEEGDKGFEHAKVVFSNKKPRVKSYFWTGYKFNYVKPQITIK